MNKNKINLDKLFEGMTEEEKNQKIDELEKSYQDAFTNHLKNMSELERKNFVTSRLREGKPFVNNSPKLSRNDKCFCGSGKKYKNCCMSEVNEYTSFKEYYDYLQQLNKELANKVKDTQGDNVEYAEVVE